MEIGGRKAQWQRARAALSPEERKRAHIAQFEASCSTAISDECRELPERCGQGEGER